MELTLRGCAKRALQDTHWGRVLSRDVGIAILTVALAILLLPEKEAMDQIKQVALTVGAAIIIWPLLELTWNFLAAPFRILNERLGLIVETLDHVADGQVRISAQVERAETLAREASARSAPEPTQRLPVEPAPPPDYALWGRREYIRIDYAALLIEGINPQGGDDTPHSMEVRGLLMDAARKGELVRPHKTAAEWQSAKRYHGGWLDVEYYSEITLKSLLHYLEREKLGADFLERIRPHVPER